MNVKSGWLRATLVVSAVLVAVAAAIWSATADRRDRTREGKTWSMEALATTIDRLKPLQAPLGKPRPGDWLAHHKEPGQTFAEYAASRPVIPDGARRTIYIQPLGEFSAEQRRIITEVAAFIGLYFNLPVKTLDDLPLSVIPDSARRTHPTWGVRQVLTTYVLDDVLKPRLRKDAFALIAFTAHDLWPGEGWNFVFGQASLRERVGVWSIHRYGDPSESEAAYRLTLLRAMRCGSHELGHMLSMYHCTAYECNMCGSNSLDESDRRPLALCPECMAKVCWATRTDPVERCRRLADFCEKPKLDAEVKRYREQMKTLSPQTTRP